MCLNLPGRQLTLPPGKDVDGTGNCIEHDECSNIAGAHVTIPDGYKRGDALTCLLDLPGLVITELLPNYADPNSGVDTGHEFIEIYNPTNQQADLSNYIIFCWIKL